MHMDSYISSLLNRRLPAAVHDYLDLPTEQLAATAAAPLQVSLAWGNLTISGVNFKSSLLQRLLGLPIQLTQAEINRASLQIPWFTLLWKPVVLELDGVTVVVVAGADASVARASRASQAPGQSRARPQKQAATLPVWLHALLRWALQKVVVRITAVSVRYESVGRCLYQQSGPAAVELWLGALELNGIPTGSAAHTADDSSDNKPIGGTLTLQELAIGVQSLRVAAGAADTEQPSWLLLQSTTVALSACVDMQTDRRQITAALAVHGANAQQPVAVVLPQTAVALAWGVAEELMQLFAATDADRTETNDTAEAWYDAVETEEAETISACEHTDSISTAATAAAAAVSDTTALAKAEAVPLKLIFTAEISGVSILCEPDASSSAASLKPVQTVIQRVRLSVDTMLATAERQAVVWLDVLSVTATQTGCSKPLIVLQHSAHSTQQDAVWLRVDVRLQSNVVTASCKLGDSSVTTVLAAYRAVTSCALPSTELQLALACNKHARQQRTAAAITHSKSSAVAATAANTVERQPLEYSIDVTLQSITVKLPIDPTKDSSRAVCVTLSSIAAAGEQRLTSPLTASLVVGGLMVCHNSSAQHEADTASAAAAAGSTTTICSVDDLLAVQLRNRKLTVAVAHITATATAEQIIETAWACGTALGGVHYTPYAQLKQAATAAAAVRKAHIMLPQCETVSNSVQLQWSGLHIVVLPSSRHNRVGVGPEKLLYTMPWCSAAAAKTESTGMSQPLMAVTIGDVHVSTSSKCTVNSSSSSSSSSSSKLGLHPLHSELELTVASFTVEACTAGISSITTQQQQQQQQSTDSHMLKMVSVTNFKFTKNTNLQSLTTAPPALSIGTLHAVSSVHVSDVTMQLEPVLIGRLVHLAVACGTAVRVGRESIECTLTPHKQQQAAVLLPSTSSSAVPAVPALSPDRHSVATDMNITVDSVLVGMRCQVSRLSSNISMM
jgi:N-terminal region of Chorein or VPS13